MSRAFATLGLWAALAPASAGAYCPCYTASSASNTYNCAIEAAPGQNPSVAEWSDIFALVAQGPSAWRDAGPTVADINQGCGKPEPSHRVPARFPCELLKAIAMQESGWTQFCVPDRPADQVGGASRTIISFDCGYGVGQVTSGMHRGETPSFDRLRVAGEATYNLATGAKILASKWAATQCVGDNQPAMLEHWYTAIWAYNGLSYTNNPNNPIYSSSRGVWNPNNRTAAPYQEKVYGWAEHPPSAAHGPAVALAYPKLSELGGSGAPPALPDPTCASPTNCTATRGLHRSECFEAPDGGFPDAGGGGSVDGGRADAGQDGGVDAPDAGGETVIPALDSSLGPSSAGGCGCGVGSTTSLLVAVLGLRRRRSARRRAARHQPTGHARGGLQLDERSSIGPGDLWGGTRRFRPPGPGGLAGTLLRSRARVPGWGGRADLHRPR